MGKKYQIVVGFLGVCDGIGQMETIPDQQLLADYIDANDEVAFQTLVERYVGLVLGVATRKLGRHSLAEEVAQDVFVILSRKAKTLRRQSEKLPGWLHRTTVWECHNLSRRERRRQSKMEDYQSHQNAMSEELEANALPEICEFLDEAIDTLPESDRRAVFHRFFKGHSYKEMGEILGKPEDTCQKQISRALAKLGRFFERRGLGISSVVLASLMSSELAKAAPTGLAQTFTTGVLGGTSTLTKTQLTMHAYHSVLQSKVILGVGTVSAVIGLGWVAVSQGDEPPQDANRSADEVSVSQAGEPPAGARAESKGKTRLILPPGADRSDPEIAALIQSVDEVADGRDRGSLLTKMEPDEIARQLQAVQNLTTVIAAYSGRNGDSLPQSLDQLRQMEDGKHEKYLTFKHKNLVLPYLYVSGLDSETIDRNKTPLVLSPILVSGQRIVGRQNGSAVLMDEAELQLLLKETLKANPEAKLLHK